MRVDIVAIYDSGTKQLETWPLAEDVPQKYDRISIGDDKFLLVETRRFSNKGHRCTVYGRLFMNDKTDIDHEHV